MNCEERYCVTGETAATAVIVLSLVALSAQTQGRSATSLWLAPREMPRLGRPWKGSGRISKRASVSLTLSRRALLDSRVKCGAVRSAASDLRSA